MTATSVNEAPGTRSDARVAAWVKVAASVALVALVGGSMIAETRQPGDYSPVGSTISDLAATTARDAWIMTSAFVITGLALLGVAGGLRIVPLRARMAIGAGGIGVLVVAAAPLPYYGQLHTVAAFLALAALAVWPVLAIDPVDGLTGSAARHCAAVTVFGLALLVVLEVAPGVGGFGGLVERVLAGGELVWLALVTIRCGDPW